MFWVNGIGVESWGRIRPGSGDTHEPRHRQAPHPDDPESSCGRWPSVRPRQDIESVWPISPAGSGPVYGDGPWSRSERAEARAACEILGADPVLRLQDAEVQFDRETLDRVGSFLDGISPDVIVRNWPLDTHPDHQAVSILVTQACLKRRDIGLVLFRVRPGPVLRFQPNRYVGRLQKWPCRAAGRGLPLSQTCGVVGLITTSWERARARRCAWKRAEGYLSFSPIPVGRGCSRVWRGPWPQPYRYRLSSQGRGDDREVAWTEDPPLPHPPLHAEGGDACCGGRFGKEAPCPGASK